MKRLTFKLRKVFDIEEAASSEVRILFTLADIDEL